jgi:chromosome segregation ATPase
LEGQLVESAHQGGYDEDDDEDCEEEGDDDGDSSEDDEDEDDEDDEEESGDESGDMSGDEEDDNKELEEETTIVTPELNTQDPAPALNHPKPALKGVCPVHGIPKPTVPGNRLSDSSSDSSSNTRENTNHSQDRVPPAIRTTPLVPSPPNHLAEAIRRSSLTPTQTLRKAMSDAQNALSMYRSEAAKRKTVEANNTELARNHSQAVAAKKEADNELVHAQNHIAQLEADRRSVLLEVDRMVKDAGAEKSRLRRDYERQIDEFRQGHRRSIQQLERIDQAQLHQIRNQIEDAHKTRFVRLSEDHEREIQTLMNELARTQHARDHLAARMKVEVVERTALRTALVECRQELGVKAASEQKYASRTNELETKYTQAEKYYRTLGDDLKKRENECQMLKNEHKELGDELKRLEAGHGTLKNEYKELEGKHKKLGGEYAKLEYEHDKHCKRTAAEEELNKQKDAAKALEVKWVTDELADFRRQIQKQLDADKTMIAQYQAEANTQQSQNSALRKQNERLASKLKEAQLDYDEVRLQYRELQKTKEADEEATKEKEAKYADYYKKTELAIPRYAQELRGLSAELATSKDTVSRISDEIKHLKIQNARDIDSLQKYLDERATENEALKTQMAQLVVDNSSNEMARFKTEEEIERSLAAQRHLILELEESKKAHKCQVEELEATKASALGKLTAALDENDANILEFEHEMAAKEVRIKAALEEKSKLQASLDNKIRAASRERAELESELFKVKDTVHHYYIPLQNQVQALETQKLDYMNIVKQTEERYNQLNQEHKAVMEDRNKMKENIQQLKIYAERRAKLWEETEERPAAPKTQDSGEAEFLEEADFEVIDVSETTE